MSMVKLCDLKKKGEYLEGDSLNPTDTTPAWLDIQKFRRGQRFFQKHILSFILMLHFSLVVGFSLINLLKPLVFTGRSDTAKKALKRYKDTFHHIALWHFGDVWEAPSGKAHKSVLKIRKMHASVASSMQKAEPHKIHISQYDMCLVQSGFFGAVVMYPEEFGIKCSKEDLEDYVYFWRGIGYLLGISDDYNLCSWGYENAISLVKEIEQDLLLPATADLPQDFHHMCQAYLDGTNPGVPLFSKVSMFSIFNDVHGIKSTKSAGFADRLRIVFFHSITTMIRWCPGFELMCNTLLTLLLTREMKLLSV